MKTIKRTPVTVLVAVKNEAINLSKCLKSLQPAERVVLLDSHSKDGTTAIAKRFGAEVVQFNYKGGYPKKRQWAFDYLKIKTKWILLIDADEEVPRDLWTEINREISSVSPFQAYLIKKQFHFMGKKFRFGGFSFEAVLLFQKGKARFEHLIDEPASAMDMEVHERLIVDGTIGKIRTALLHNDYKNLESFVDRHNKYSTWEAKVRESFAETGRYGQTSIEPRFLGNSQERRRFQKKLVQNIPFEPFVWFLYHYLFHLGFLEGQRGWIACLFKAQYIFQVRAKMKEIFLKSIEKNK